MYKQALHDEVVAAPLDAALKQHGIPCSKTRRPGGIYPGHSLRLSIAVRYLQRADVIISRLPASYGVGPPAHLHPSAGGGSETRRSSLLALSLKAVQVGTRACGASMQRIHSLQASAHDVNAKAVSQLPELRSCKLQLARDVHILPIRPCWRRAFLCLQPLLDCHSSRRLC